MKCKKILILFLALFALVSVLALSAAAEDSYSDYSNGLRYSDLKAAFVDPYEGAYCVMVEYGVFEFHYPKEKPTALVFKVDDFWDRSHREEPCTMHFYFDVTLYASSDSGFRFDAIKLDFPWLENTDTSYVGIVASDYLTDGDVLTLRYPMILVGEFYGSYIDNVFEGNADNWHPFVDLADVPTSPPAVSDTDDGSVLPVLGEMIGILTGGIPLFAAGLGGGLSEFVLNVFTNGSGSDMTLSVFGAVLIIFSGLALAIGLSKFIVGWVTSLGSSG